MSMLTPPGMGRQYRIKGDRFPRMRPPRRRRRFVLASASMVVTLGVLSWGTLQLVDVFGTNGDGSAQAAGPQDEKCARADGKTPGEGQDKKNGQTTGPAATGAATQGGQGGRPKPKDITVNVLNATKRSGLAADTAEKLKKRGFTIGDIANAPASVKRQLTEPSLLIGATGKQTTGRFKVLGSHLDGDDTRYDDRDGKDVDLVLGKGFDGLVKKQDAERAATAESRTSPAPTPSC